MRPKRASCFTRIIREPCRELHHVPDDRAAVAGACYSVPREVISVVTFKWRPTGRYRSEFSAEQVNILRRMVARHYSDSHQFICVTDDPTGLDPEVKVVPLWDDYAEIPNPSFTGGPSCYRRLKVFSRGIGEVLGERFVCLDLDMLITGDLRPLLNRTEDFIAWKNPNPLWPYNGSMFMLTAGTRPEVWESFDPETSPAISHAAKCKGSDQGWMSYVLGKGEATWGPEDGVWSYQDEIVGRRRILRGRFINPGVGMLPKNAKVIVFHGPVDPWSRAARVLTPWVKEHYR